VTFYRRVVGDVTLQPGTVYASNPARGSFSQTNVWCPSVADVNKSIGLYARYTNARGASIQDTVRVRVIQ